MPEDDFDIDDLRRSNTNSNPPSFGTDEPRQEPKQLRNKATVILVLVVAVFCFCAGRGCGRAPEIVHAEPGATVTVTVTKTIKGDKVPVMPAACSDALDMAAKMQPFMNQIVTQGGKTTDILGRARIAVAEQDHQALVRLGNEVNTALNASTHATAELMDLQRRYTDQIILCNTALGR